MFNSKIKPCNLSIYVEYHRLRKKESNHPKAVLFTGSLRRHHCSPTSLPEERGYCIVWGKRRAFKVIFHSTSILCV